MDSNLVRRIGFAVVAIPTALAVVYVGGVALVVLVALAAMLGTAELFGLAERREIRPARRLGVWTAAALAGLVYAALVSPAARSAILSWWPYAAALWLMVAFTWALAVRSPTDRPLEAVAITVLAVAYAGALPLFLLDIRHGRYPEQSWAGAWMVFYPLVVTWVCDTAAMFGGRAIGGPKLAPTVSPGKTRSGSLAGVLAGLAVAPLFHAAIFPGAGITIPLWQLLVIAGVL
jgi:phosphatidate cytidylyltransferase